MNSDYCYSIEMKSALERHERGEATVIPIILRPIYWQGALGKLQALPTNARPAVSSSWHMEEAFFDVAEGIRKVVQEYQYRILAAASEGKFRFHVKYVIVPSPAKKIIQVLNPISVFRGNRIVLSYHISNDLKIEVPIWLGADLEMNDRYYFNIHEDTDAILQPGDHEYIRSLTIREDWPIGSYHLDAAIHYGVRSDPANSIRLAKVWINSSLLSISS